MGKRQNDSNRLIRIFPSVLYFSVTEEKKTNFALLNAAIIDTTAKKTRGDLVLLKILPFLREISEAVCPQSARSLKPEQRH